MGKFPTSVFVRAMRGDLGRCSGNLSWTRYPALCKSLVHEPTIMAGTTTAWTSDVGDILQYQPGFQKSLIVEH